MLGLCHECLISGIEVFITKGRIHCMNCNGSTRNNKKEKEKKEEKKLEFEDLPQADLEIIHQYAEDQAGIFFNNQLILKMAEDRLHDRD